MLSQTLETRLLAYSYLLVRIEQLTHHCKYFHEIICLRIFPKSIDKIQVSLKYNAYNGTLYECLCKHMTTSGCIILRMRNISNLQKKSISTSHF